MACRSASRTLPGWLIWLRRTASNTEATNRSCATARMPDWSSDGRDPRSRATKIAYSPTMPTACSSGRVSQRTSPARSSPSEAVPPARMKLRSFSVASPLRSAVAAGESSIRLRSRTGAVSGPMTVFAASGVVRPARRLRASLMSISRLATPSSGEFATRRNNSL